MMEHLISNPSIVHDNASGGVQRGRARFSGRMALTVNHDSSVQVIYASFDNDDFTRGTYTDLSLGLSDVDFRAAIARCLGVWETALSDCTTKSWGRTRRPYEDHYQHDSSCDYVQQLGARLAVAGLDLFNSIFAQRSTVEAGLSDSLIDYVRRASALGAAGKPGLERLKISSPALWAPMAPWQLLYTHPDGNLSDDGSNFRWDGFWGTSISIDQEPGRHHGSIVLSAAERASISASVSFDERIDGQFGVDFVRRQLAWFDGLQVLDVARRNTRKDLAVALQSAQTADQIFYFYCHGHCIDDQQIALFLTDNEPITPADLRRWLLSCRRGGFSPSPLVFINTCKGGRLSVDALNTAAREWLSLGAAGVVGPVIDIPATFAANFATDFFARFLSESGDNLYAGDILVELTRYCLFEHGNPLALTYTMYRAAECFVQWPSHNVTSGPVGGPGGDALPTEPARS